MASGNGCKLTAEAIACAALFFGIAAVAATLPSNFAEQAIGSGWTDVNGITFAADGRAIVWERVGRVWVMENDVKPSQPMVDIREEVGAWRDHGLLGVALHPDFLNNGWIYLLYVVDHHHLVQFGTTGYSSSQNEYLRATIGRVTRYTARASDNFRTIDPASRVVLLGESISNGFPIVFTSHGVGSLAFGEDGTLLVSCGDGGSSTSTDIGSASETYYSQAISEGIMPPGHNVGTFRAQMLSSLNGKILRLDPASGDGLPGNPFFDANYPRSPRSRLWSLGLRNPFRFTVRPGTGSHNRADGNPGVLYIGDVGWTARDDLNICTAGGQNFGWPIFEGLEAQSSYAGPNIANQDAPNPLFGIGGCTQRYFLFRDLIKQASLGPLSWPNPCNTSQLITNVPVFVHTRPAFDWYSSNARVGIFNGANAAVATLGSSSSPVAGQSFTGECSVGGVWYVGNDFPAAYRNTYFHADYVGEWIKNFVFDEQNRPIEVRNFASGAGAVVCLATHPLNGGLYYVSWPSTVRRIRYSGNLVPIARATADRTFGPAPLSIAFNGSASQDPEGLPLTYRWTFGDGSPPNTNANPTHVFNAPPGVPSRFDVALTVIDRSGATNTARLVVSVNNSPPTVRILSPTNGTSYPRGRDTVFPCVADIGDAEHDSTQLTCAWQTVFHHNAHTHPEPVDTNCATFLVTSPAECDGQTYFYRVLLIVTDAAGLATTNEVALLPNCDPARPEVSWTNPVDIVYGAQLSGTQLNASANVPGQFFYSPPAGTVLNAGSNQLLSAQFQPHDSVNYTGVTAQATITVRQAMLEIRADDQTNAYGSALPDLTVTYTGFVATDTPASLDTAVAVQTAATAQSPPGTYAIVASGAADANYLIAHVNGTLTIVPGTPVITWTKPASIALGMPLGAAELNAAANVTGSYVYDPPAGTVLPAGSGQTLSVLFTPGDTNYRPATASVLIDVVGPPSAPANALATVSRLTWIDTAAMEDGFKVERSFNGLDFSQLAMLAANVTNLAISPVRGVTNYYRVRAFNVAGDSAYSDPATVFTPRLSGPLTTTFIPSNSVWKFLDDGSSQGAAWTALEFSDSSWQSGPAELGYGNAPQATTVSFGPDADARFITTYFRRAFDVADATVYTNLFCEVVRDDGVVVHLNGHEIFRSNMPQGPVTHTTVSSASVGGADEKRFFPTNIAPSWLVTGVNVLAVELHQSSPGSGDIGFNLQLTGGGFVPELAFFEADLAPRPYGDNSGGVGVADWVQAGRFVAGLDHAMAGSEFQRADCAPASSLGDGILSVGDWVQAGRYAAGLDSVHPAGGATELAQPSALLSSLAWYGDPSGAVSEWCLQILDTQIVAGMANTIAIALSGARYYDSPSPSSVGEMNYHESWSQSHVGGTSYNGSPTSAAPYAVGFTLGFDPAILRFRDAALANGFTEARLLLNTNEVGLGHLGVAVALAMPGREAPAATLTSCAPCELLRLRFDAAATAVGRSASFSFTDRVVVREISDPSGQPFPTDFAGATISVAPPSSTLRLVMPEQFAEGAIRLWIRHGDGSPIDATKVEVVTATNLALPMSQWTRLGTATVLTNGLLQIEDTDPNRQTTRFYRAVERL